jgi:peptide/nickel transport system permease protein
MSNTEKQKNGFGKWLHNVLDGDLWYSFTRSPLTVAAAIVTIIIILCAVFAPMISPQNPFDMGSLDLMDAHTPPAWEEDGDPRFIFGTDDQGRDILSTILFGSRISLLVGFFSVVFAMTIGVSLGLLSGYFGGTLDALIMRIAEIQISFPAILMALLLAGVLRTVFAIAESEVLAIGILVFSIGISGWVQYARTVRSGVMVEKNKDYIMAARVVGLHPVFIMLRHVLPNVMGPVLVIATIHLAVAIISEATLSFLGVGVPPTHPSLGTLIRIGNDFLFSGEWWITLFPAVALATLVLAVNLLGDWLRDALNPKLR